MSYTADNLISTSVDDARITLTCGLERNPHEVKQVAQQVLEQIEGKSGQLTRTAVMRTMIRRADKLIG